MRKILTIIFVMALISGMMAISPCLTEASVEKASLSSLKEGRALLKAGKYNEAIEKLKTAYKEIPVFGDYILYFIADAYSKAKQYDDSNQFAEKIFQGYPDSLLKAKIEALKIRNSLGKKDPASEGTVGRETLKLMERYVETYPDDAEMKFALGKFLKKQGRTDRAGQVFKSLYISCNSYSEAAYSELRPSDITPSDMLAKASNLIKNMEYEKAETILSQALLNGDRSLKSEIHKKIGISLFRQKRYRKAADEFLKAGDIYNTSRALYRAGDMETFRNTVSRLVSMNDERAVILLDALALKKRREGNTEEALQIFNDIQNKYPSHNENAMWGIAWTYYRNGDYKKAYGLLTELYKEYPVSRYLYWRDRSAENMLKPVNNTTTGAAPDITFRQSMYPDKDFYGLLVQAKDKELAGYYANRQEPSEYSSLCTKKTATHIMGLKEDFLARKQNSEYMTRLLERFGIFTELGMNEEAVSEIMQAAQKISNNEDIVYLSYKLQEAGAYRKAINLITHQSLLAGKHQRDISEINIEDILYPLAYWPVVRNASIRYKIDPFILLSVMREESRYDPAARSVTGAIGLMQVMPHTAYILDREVKADISNKAMIHDVRINILLGAYYLRVLLDEFKSMPVAIAAYNAGHEKVREWLKNGNYKAYDEFIEDIAFDETRNYVKKVLMSYNTYRQRAIKTGCLTGNDTEEITAVH